MPPSGREDNEAALRGRIESLERHIAGQDQELGRLRQLEQQIRVVIDSTVDYAFILFDRDNRIRGWNVGAERIFGYSDDEVLGLDGSALFTPEDRARQVPQRELEQAVRNGRAEDERWHIRKDGTRFWGSGMMHVLHDDAPRYWGFLKIVRDLTERRQAEQSLRQSEERFRLFAENVTDYSLIQVDLSGRVAGWNTGARRTLGYREAEIVGLPISLFFTPEDVASGVPERDLARALANGRSEEARWLVRKDGQRFWARWVTTPIRNESGVLHGYANVLRDETERQNAEERLRASLVERDVLLQEIHHRVKNNLQVIVSLLDIQSMQIADPAVLTMFLETQNRVRAIAAIHETLYSSADLASIDFGTYLQHLARDLFAFYKMDDRIHLEIESDDMVLDISQAVPLGLILNEAVTNCLRHAFPSGRAGRVRIGLCYLGEELQPGQSRDEGFAKLSIKDDGAGFPPGYRFETAETMGMKLIKILARQVHGRVEINTEEGAEVRITFPLSVS